MSAAPFRGCGKESSRKKGCGAGGFAAVDPVKRRSAMAEKNVSNAAGGVFSAHPSISYIQSIVSNLPAKTGRSLEEWAALVTEQKLDSDKDRRAWLKSTHKLGGTTVNLIIHELNGTGRELFEERAYLAAAEGYVEEQYAGSKAALRPVFEALLKASLSLGSDVRACPCKTIVPIYRSFVFAEIKPATMKRVDLGLALKGVQEAVPARLIPTGGLEKGDRITHRIPIESLRDVDGEVKKWLKLAYDLDA